MTARQHLPRDERLHLGIEIEKADRIRDRGTVFADALGDFLLLQTKFLGQSRISLGLFERIEILALEVLDQGHLEHVAVRGIAHDHRHLRQLQLGRGPPAALAGDELVFAVDETHDERLDHPVFADRIDQFGEILLVESLPWLQGRGHHLVERDAEDALARARIIGLTSARRTHRHRTRRFDQGVETATESFFWGEVVRHLAKRARRKIRENQRASLTRRCARWHRRRDRRSGRPRPSQRAVRHCRRSRSAHRARHHSLRGDRWRASIAPLPHR